MQRAKAAMPRVNRIDEGSISPGLKEIAWRLEQLPVQPCGPLRAIASKA